MTPRIAAVTLALLLAVAASTPLWLGLPAPQGTQRIAAAQFDHGDGQAPVPVWLPHTWSGDQHHGRYRITFELAQVPDQPLQLFIPLLSQRAVVFLGGREIADTRNHALLFGVTSGIPALVTLPSELLAVGTNVLELEQEALGMARGYLSPLHLGSAAELVPHYWSRSFLLVHLRLMSLALHLLILAAVLLAWIYRPREPLFAWLLLLHVVSLPSYVGLLPNLQAESRVLVPYAFMLNTAACLILPIIALLINAAAVPRWLKRSVVIVPLASVLALLAGLGSVPTFGIGLFLLAICSSLTAVVISAWGAIHKRINEAWLLLLPLLVLTMVLLRDGAVSAGWLQEPIYLTVYYRPLLTISILAILMRRLGISLMQLDDANAELKRKLAQREEELARLYEEERIEAARRVRSQERQRLTADLHDGLSGHLASIIALAEREQADDIKHSAREALDDLRLVIYSLDIGDRELHVTLSDFRERLERQLKRLRIKLDWSMSKLPEISGVTPAHALNVLRILQEAVTNAIKHGPATHLTIHGHAGADGTAEIVVQNDGTPDAPGSGSGMENMRRRTALLGGSVHIDVLPGGGARLVLRLPLRLPGGAPTA